MIKHLKQRKNRKTLLGNRNGRPMYTKFVKLNSIYYAVMVVFIGKESSKSSWVFCLLIAKLVFAITTLLLIKTFPLKTGRCSRGVIACITVTQTVLEIKTEWRLIT